MEHTIEPTVTVPQSAESTTANAASTDIGAIAHGPPPQVAAFIVSNPRLSDAIMTQLHQTRGNSFVADVLHAVAKQRRLLDAPARSKLPLTQRSNSRLDARPTLGGAELPQSQPRKAYFNRIDPDDGQTHAEFHRPRFRLDMK